MPKHQSLKRAAAVFDLNNKQNQPECLTKFMKHPVDGLHQNKIEKQSTTSVSAPEVEKPSVLLGDEQGYTELGGDVGKTDVHVGRRTPRKSRMSSTLVEQNTPGGPFESSRSQPSTKKSQRAASFAAGSTMKKGGKSDRPSMSYAGMIVQAIVSSPGARMALRQLYDWIMETYPYFKTASKNWQNSIRHNLSVQTHFVRLYSGEDKTTLWTVEPQFLKKYEYEGIVPKGTFNILHNYIAQLIACGSDRTPVPNAELWPVTLGQRQVVRFKTDENAGALNRFKNLQMSLPPTIAISTAPVDVVYNSETAIPQQSHPLQMPQQIPSKSFISFNLRNNELLVQPPVQLSDNEISDLIQNMTPEQWEALVGGTPACLTQQPPSEPLLSATPPDCDISRLTAISPCNFHQGMELLPAKSHEYISDLPLPISSQWTDDRPFSFIPDDLA